MLAEAPRLLYRAIGFALLVGMAGGGGALLLRAHHPSPPSEAPPPGYLEMQVGPVVPQGGGWVLFLDDESSREVPIYIGAAEATTINLRAAGRKPVRPLTADLLESVMHELGGQLVRVQVDALRDGIYYGSIWVRHDGRVSRIDARPSDAIALAVGARVPVYVARDVAEAAR